MEQQVLKTQYVKAERSTYDRWDRCGTYRIDRTGGLALRLACGHAAFLKDKRTYKLSTYDCVDCNDPLPQTLQRIYVAARRYGLERLAAQACLVTIPTPLWWLEFHEKLAAAGICPEWEPPIQAAINAGRRLQQLLTTADYRSTSADKLHKAVLDAWLNEWTEERFAALRPSGQVVRPSGN